ncbi:MAG: hypothetical protein J1F17_04990 [Oscillospiraceae bacterium]|nr:hypothetical protein [Oscillospiraceae bacterium]
MAEKKEFMTYKGKPLVRCGKELYYGSMEEPFVIHLIIKSTKDVNGLDVADKVAIQLMSTDPNLPPRKQLVKSSEKKGLYLAMDIAEAWLNKALKEYAKNA